MVHLRDKYKIIYGAVIIILLLNLFFIYLLKYTNQGLSLSEFSLSNPGNIINLLFILLIIAGIVVLLFRKEIKENTRTIVTLTIILNILLIISSVLNFIPIPMPDYYVLDYHISRVVVGIMFAIYQFMTAVFLSTVWLFIMGYNRFLFLRAVINSAFIFALLFGFAVIYLNINSRSSEIPEGNSNNVGVVMGAAVWRNKPSPSLSSRADKAAKLLSEGKIEMIQLTGSNAPGEISEAEMAYKYLVTRKVDMSRVRFESSTTSTYEQIKFVKNNLYKKNGPDIIIISDGYHLARIRDICRFQNMHVKAVSSDLVHSFRDKLYYNFREAIGIIIFWLFAL